MQSNLTLCICPQCGTEFTPKARRFPPNRFCSASCGAKGRRRPTVEDRFWKLVNKTDDCWLWIGKDLSHNGYGQLAIGHKKFRVHRLSWEMHNGPILDGLLVLHNCPTGDNPACVRPDHLFLGTAVQNRADCVAKGRQAKGKNVAGAKLTDTQVTSIRELAQDGVTHEQISRQFGLNQGTVTNIVVGKTWKHLPVLWSSNENRYRHHRGSVRLTDEQKRQIVQRMRAGDSRHAIAADLDISHVTVWRIGRVSDRKDRQ